LKFAVTADLHLTKQGNSQRYLALNAILQKMREIQVNILVIAGDLFDASDKNYSDFEKVCTSALGKNVQFYIIPGNHDAELNSRMFAAGNVRVISKPEIVPFDMMSMPVLFVPYTHGRSMGEMISQVSDDIDSGKWILIGHGDWVETLGQVNPHEPGLYMPLTRVDVETYKPSKVILGHIHKPYDSSIVFYPGSPCPLDINETGRRRFLLVDSEKGDVQSVPFNEPVIYFNEKLLILPVEDEEEYLKNQAQALFKRWAISDNEREKVKIRIRVRGYTKDKSALAEIVRNLFKEYSFYNNEEPDLSEVYVSDDTERNEIALKVREAVLSTFIKKGETEPAKDDIIIKAMQIIYGDK